MGRQNSGEKNTVYRLSLIDNATHKTIRTVRFTKVFFITFSVTAVVVVVLALYCIIAFTPIRTTIPGYPDANYERISVDNTMKIDSLESVILRWNLYAENLSRVLSGEKTVNIDSIIKKGNTNFFSDKSAEELSKQDSLLRETVHKEEQFGVSSSLERSLPIEGMHFFTPLKGAVATDFDNELHQGIDILAQKGTIVSAVFDGSVIYTGWDDEEGYVIILQHRDGVISVYGHNQKLLVGAGEVIKAGTPISLVGSVAGKSDKEHLHFELWQNGQALNPTKFISF